MKALKILIPMAILGGCMSAANHPDPLVREAAQHQTAWEKHSEECGDIEYEMWKNIPITENGIRVKTHVSLLTLEPTFEYIPYKRNMSEWPEARIERCRQERIKLTEETSTLAGKFRQQDCDDMIYGHGETVHDAIEDMSHHEISECWKRYHKRGY